MIGNLPESPVHKFILKRHTLSEIFPTLQLKLSADSLVVDSGMLVADDVASSQDKQQSTEFS